MRRTFYPAIALIVAAIASPADAITFSWTNPSGGDFDDQANWSPGSTSTSWPNDGADVATFNTVANTYTVDFDASITNDRFEVRVGHPTFDLHDPAIPIGSAYTYTLDTTTSAAAIISTFPGALFSTSLTLSGGSGGGGSRSAVQTSQVLQIAEGASNTQGTLNLNGTNWTSTAATYVGLNGNGTLDLNTSSKMTSHSGVLGFTQFSVGTADISGEWENTTGALVVGKEGTGTLNIDTTSGFVHTTAGDILIAEESGSVGTINLFNDGRLESDGSLYVGGGPSGPGGNGNLISTGFILGENITIGDDFVIYGNGTVDLELGDRIYIENDTVIHPGGSLTLGRGDFVTETLTGPANSITWTEGQFFVQNEISIDANAPLGGNVSVSSFFNQELSTNLLKVGPTAGGTLTLTGEAGGGIVEIGSLIPGTDPATVTLNNAAALLEAVSIEVRGTTNATLNVQGGGDVYHLFSSRLAEFAGTNATVNVTGTGSTWDGGAALYVGGNLNTPGGTAVVSVSNQAVMQVDDFLKLWGGATMLVDNATLTIDNLEVAGSLTLQNNAVFNTNAATDVVVSGALSIGTNIAFDIPDLTVTEGGHVTFANQFVKVDPLGSGNIDRLFLQGGTITVGPPIEFLSSTFQGYGTLDGVVIANKGVFATGDLTMGRADVVNAVRISEDIAFTVGAHHVTVLEKGFWDMHSFTRIMGGTLSVPNGVSMRPGLYLSAFGAIDGRMFVHGGTTIEADGGDLTLGDPNSLAGFFSDGELYTGSNTVTIHDANEAVLGSLTVLGDGANPGTLVAANGLLVEFGKNIAGYGTVDTPNDPTKPLINNGFIGGNSVSEPVTLNGYVKGVGTFGDVVINGTLSPGFSPGRADVAGSVVFGAAATYEAELAGSGGVAGGDYDQVNVTANVSLDGTLDVVLLNGFTPEYLDEFVILTAGSHSGAFGQMSGLFINPDMTLAPVYDYAGNIGLTLVAAIPGDANLDGIVNGLDLLRWQSNLFSGDQWVQGDFNLDGLVNGLDLLTWQSHLFDSVQSLGGGAAAAAQSVPEPGAVWLLAVGGAGLLPRRRVGRSTPIG